MSFVAHYMQSGYFALQDHREGLEPHFRACMAGVRVIDARGSDDEWAGWVWDEEDGIEVRGDFHPWRWWSARDSRGFGSFTQAMFATVTKASGGGSNAAGGPRPVPGETVTSADEGGVEIQPIRRGDYFADGRFHASPQSVPSYWPIPAKGTIVLGGAGTEERSQEELFGWIDPRLVAVNKNPSDAMGSLVVDLEPAGSLSRRRVARLQTAVRVAHVPKLTGIGNEEGWSAAWQLAATGQGAQCGYGVSCGMVDESDPEADPSTTPTDEGGPTITPGDEWAGGGQPPPGSPGDGEGARAGGYIGPSDAAPVTSGDPSDVAPGGRAAPGAGGRPGIPEVEGGEKPASFGLGLASRDGWGMLHVGHKSDKHLFEMNDDGEPVNSLHMDPDRTLWYRDKDRDAPLEFRKEPYGPVEAPMLVQAWIKYDRMEQHQWNGESREGLWRLEGQCFWTGKGGPPPPPTGDTPEPDPEPEPEPEPEPDPPPTITPPSGPHIPTGPATPATPGTPGTAVPTGPGSTTPGGSSGGGTTPGSTTPGSTTPGGSSGGGTTPGSVTPPGSPGPTTPGEGDGRADDGPDDGGGGRGRHVPPWPPAWPPEIPVWPIPPGPPEDIPWPLYPAAVRYLSDGTDRSAPRPEAVAYTPQNVGMAAVLAFPQHLNRPGGIDYRSSAKPGHDNVLAEGTTRPAVARMEAFGAEAGEDWNYTERPESSRVPGGTAAGGWIVMPPEVDRQDADDDYAPAGVTTSTTYLATAPGAYFGAGKDDASGDLADDSFRWSKSGTDLVFEALISGTWTTVLTIPQDGYKVPVALTSYIDRNIRFAEQNIHGALQQLVTADTLATGDDVSLDTGIGKLIIVVNAGPDLAGDITVTGTSVDRDDGVETGSDTDVITIAGVTTDNGGTDGHGNTTHDLSDAYITSKWFTGAIVISTTEVDISDVDVYLICFEQFNDEPNIEVTSLDITTLPTNTNAELDAHLYSVQVTGNSAAVTEIATLTVDTPEDDTYVRLRRGDLGVELDGTTDGIFLDLILGPASQTYWDDTTIKVWAKLGP